MTKQTIPSWRKKYRRIRTVAGLRRAIMQGHTDFFILLNFGARSSKNITEFEGKFHVLHEIDGTMGEYTPEELSSSGVTNIAEAMRCGAFFCYLSYE